MSIAEQETEIEKNVMGGGVAMILKMLTNPVCIGIYVLIALVCLMTGAFDPSTVGFKVGMGFLGLAIVSAISWFLYPGHVAMNRAIHVSLRRKNKLTKDKLVPGYLANPDNF